MTRYRVLMTQYWKMQYRDTPWYRSECCHDIGVDIVTSFLDQYWFFFVPSGVPSRDQQNDPDDDDDDLNCDREIYADEMRMYHAGQVRSPRRHGLVTAGAAQAGVGHGNLSDAEWSQYQSQHISCCHPGAPAYGAAGGPGQACWIHYTYIVPDVVYNILPDVVSDIVPDIASDVVVYLRCWLLYWDALHGCWHAPILLLCQCGKTTIYKPSKSKSGMASHLAWWLSGRACLLEGRGSWFESLQGVKNSG